jgi:integrase
MKGRDLPRRVYERHGAWYFVDTQGKWHKLARVKHGMPAMYRALADLAEGEITGDRMPAVIGRWMTEKRAIWAVKTLRDQERIAAQMSKAFAKFKPDQITSKICGDYLKKFKATPRTYNMHRTMLGQVLSFAAVDGLRDGHNPVDDVKALPLPPRKRIVIDTEIEAIKTAARQMPSRHILVRMIDLALITGQRISDLISITWADVQEDGIRVTQQKTGEKLLIEWSDALRAAVEACAPEAERTGPLLRTPTGGAYTYDGISSLWKRTRAVAAEELPSVRDLHIHDLRGRAGVDALLANGEDVRAAQRLLGHRGEAMTRHYVDGKYHKRAKPSR